MHGQTMQAQPESSTRLRLTIACHTAKRGGSLSQGRWKLCPLASPHRPLQHGGHLHSPLGARQGRQPRRQRLPARPGHGPQAHRDRPRPLGIREALDRDEPVRQGAGGPQSADDFHTGYTLHRHDALDTDLEVRRPYRAVSHRNVSSTVNQL